MFLKVLEIPNNKNNSDKAAARREIECSGSLKYVCIKFPIAFEIEIRIGNYLNIQAKLFKCFA